MKQLMQKSPQETRFLMRLGAFAMTYNLWLLFMLPVVGISAEYYAQFITGEPLYIFDEVKASTHVTALIFGAMQGFGMLSVVYFLYRLNDFIIPTNQRLNHDLNRILPPAIVPIAIIHPMSILILEIFQPEPSVKFPILAILTMIYVVQNWLLTSLSLLTILAIIRLRLFHVGVIVVVVLLEGLGFISGFLAFHPTVYFPFNFFSELCVNLATMIYVMALIYAVIQYPVHQDATPTTLGR